MFQTIFVGPIYNAFIFLLGISPAGDVGIAIIALTVLVRAVFYPMFTSSIRTQMALQAVQPELAVINEKYKDDTMERSRRTAELFQKHRIRPLSFALATIVQIVVFIALSYAFFRLSLPHIHTELLYPFVHAPSVVNQHFFGLLDLTTTHHLFLAAIVTALQYFVIRLSLARTMPSATTGVSKEKLMAQNMQRQMMTYLFPAMMAFIGYTFPAAVGLYLAATNAISLLQELYIRRKPL